MRAMRTWGGVLALVAAVQLAGCSDSLGANELPGEYTLEEVNGRDLPYGLTAGGGANSAVEGGSMVLGSGGVAQVKLNYVTTVGSTQSRFTETYNGTWAADDEDGWTINLTNPPRVTATRISGSTLRLLIAHNDTDVREYYFRK